MNHKVANLPSGEMIDTLHQSESNPILNAPPAGINDRVRLEKLNHIPSVKSNLMTAEGNKSQTELSSK